MKSFFSKKSPTPDAGSEVSAFLSGGRKASPTPSTSPSPRSAPKSSAGNSNQPPRDSSNGSTPIADHLSGGSSGYGGSRAGDLPKGGAAARVIAGGNGIALDRHATADNFDSSLDELFAGARQRQLQLPSHNNPRSQVPEVSGDSFRNGSAAGQQFIYQPNATHNSSRQLTAEEEEEEDVEAVKQQIRFTKQESVASSRNALRVAAQAEETGRNTLARLGAQGERLHNTEKNLDLAASHSRVAEQKSKELKAANGSMFAMHMKNPLRSAARAKEEEAKILARHRADRENREKAKEFAFESKNGVGNALNSAGRYGGPGCKMSLAERSKYQFEGDESDDEKEREIENNLDALGSITGRLRNLAMATSTEVDRQNAQIDKIMKKSDKVEDQVAITHSRIRKIH